MKTPAGFQELEHTADWELEVWAPDLPCLLEQAARGMYALSGIKLNDGEVQQRSLIIQGKDAESLLVKFLTELLWIEQREGLGIDEFLIDVDDNFLLKAKLKGKCILNIDKEIKAVTYHNLQVVRSAQELKVSIVFDV